MRAERDQQLGLVLARERVRAARAAASRSRQRRVGLAQMRDEQRVDARRALAV